MKNARKGFTLIELLVVIAIIGLLSTLAVVALNSAREKSRDAKRVSDIKQVQTALELYYSDSQAYPDPGTSTNLGTDLTKLDGDGFAVGDTDPTYMGLIPKDPQNTAPFLYTYALVSPTEYRIGFTLEGPTGQYKDGDASGAIECLATQDGITCN